MFKFGPQRYNDAKTNKGISTIKNEYPPHEATRYPKQAADNKADITEHFRHALKKKKQLQQQVQKYNAHQNTLQQAAFNIESAQNHKEMVTL